MKKSELIKKATEIEESITLKNLEKFKQLEVEMELENRENNRNRARSFTVGTAFGGTTEILMRGDGGRHLWCVMQPVEVVELINQLAANVGCNVDLKPRKDFASWRDWRVSEAEKRHLNGQPPFVNDMAVFQKLGALGYDDEEAKEIMDVLSRVEKFINEDDDTKILLQENKLQGAPNIMFGEEDGLIHNKLVKVGDEIIYQAGGDGGDPIAHNAEEIYESLNKDFKKNMKKSKKS